MGLYEDFLFVCLLALFYFVLLVCGVFFSLKYHAEHEARQFLYTEWILFPLCSVALCF